MFISVQREPRAQPNHGGQQLRAGPPFQPQQQQQPQQQ
jgi:hypothetical protein